MSRGLRWGIVVFIALVTIVCCDACIGDGISNCLDTIRVGNRTCPPPGFDSVNDFDLEKYIALPWYVQQQVPVSYQPPDELYCVRAKYEKVDPNNIKAGLIVKNYGNKGAVNGPSVGTSGAGQDMRELELRAVLADPNSSSPTASSKLLVGPGFLQRILPEPVWRRTYGPYWVVAYGVSQNATRGYDWAIITGGPPTIYTSGGCSTGSTATGSADVNSTGFWLFAREPVDPEATKSMRQKAQELGLDLSPLLDVQQAGCNYEGAGK